MKPQEHREVFDIEDDYWWFKAKRHLLIRTVKRLKRDLAPDAHLLDGGCGTGASLREISKLLPSVGIEKYFDGLTLCKERNLDNLVNAQLEHLPFKEETFDVVLAMDILEHVDDDTEVLNELLRVSKEGAFLIVHVPAFMFLWSDHDFAVDHKRRYTAGELTQQLRKSNFEVKFINYRLCLLFPSGILRKYFIKAKKFIKGDSSIQSCRPKVGRLLNNILYAIVVMEDLLLNYLHLPFGLSILCVARKGAKEN